MTWKRAQGLPTVLSTFSVQNVRSRLALAKKRRFHALRGQERGIFMPMLKICALENFPYGSTGLPSTPGDPHNFVHRRCAKESRPTAERRCHNFDQPEIVE
jgi:hypothetical protein